jgi:hypothetical protein
MDLNATIDIIIKDLNEVRDIIDDLKKYQGIPYLQVELAKSKCKSAAEVIGLLKDMVNKSGQIIPESKGPEKENDKWQKAVFEMDDRISEEKTTPVANHMVNIQEEESGKSPDEDKPDTGHVKVKEITRETVTEIRNSSKKTTGSAIIADQFSDMGDRINEKIGGLKHDDDISEFLKNKPLANLIEAIGINDRFLFIREIFNGDSEKYNEAISRLNSALNLDEASNMIAGYTQDDTDADAVRQLTDLLKRKFR